MKLDYRPKGYRAITPGMSAVGTPRLIEFLERAFGATLEDCTRNPDGSIGHGAIQIGDSLVEIGEAKPEWPARPCAIHLYSPDTDTLFQRAVEAGARILLPLENASYGDRAAAVQDPAGNHWYLAMRLENGPIPRGFHTLTPYVLTRGADAVMDFMKSTFGATQHMRVEKEDGSVMHAEMQIDDSMIELADGGGQWPPMPCALHVYVPDSDSVYSRAIAAGATSLYEPKDMFYGDREGGIQDSGGNHWYIATHKEDVPEEEITRRLAVAQKA
jgi:PhnB protein